MELLDVEDGAATVRENGRTHVRRQTGSVEVAVVRDGRPIYRRDKRFCYKLGNTVVPVGDREAPDRASALFRRA